ncbi:MAG: hypothetical protein BWY91_02556 [bacterium ADurb.BinA028]|nr:MAG: hypothetical protein BWY91_02556 [bacterium ADurb.BinA028]
MPRPSLACSEVARSCPRVASMTGTRAVSTSMRHMKAVATRPAMMPSAVIAPPSVAK